ncbi:hypothetical protein F7P10_17585 [Actinomadura sp. WMMB 499]|nr:hypothetical protein F7P10_17585 [Actinomadura sp. WMMB 499]
MATRACEACHRIGGSRVESAHYTSGGLVRYRRCVCGNRWVEVAEFAPDDPAPAHADPHPVRPC